MIAGLVLGPVLLAGCGDATSGGSSAPSGDVLGSGATSSEVDAGYVGIVEGTDAFIGLVVSGSNVVVYACDGESQIAEYLWGPMAEPGVIGLDSATGARVDAQLVGDTFVGTLVLPGGAEHEFTTERASGDAGMYVVVGEQAVAADVSAGWIVDNQGAQRGALRRGRTFQAAPRFERTGLVLQDAEFAVTKLVVGSTDDDTVTAVTASGLLASDETTSTEAVSPDNVLLAPTPTGPIAIPYPNTPLPTEEKAEQTG